MTGQARIDRMRELGIFQCPVWCYQPDDEHLLEQHTSGWDVVGEEGIGDTEHGATIEVRVRREWWIEGDEGHCDSYTDLCVSGLDDASEIPAMGVDELQTVIAGLEDARDKADMSGVYYRWQWAYDGAEQDAAASDVPILAGA